MYLVHTIFAALNRTRLELKPRSVLDRGGRRPSLNRTRLELKHTNSSPSGYAEEALNRTRLELKQVATYCSWAWHSLP